MSASSPLIPVLLPSRLLITFIVHAILALVLIILVVFFIVLIG